MEAFKKLGIDEFLLKAIEIEGFEKPSEIQEKAIPLVLDGKDVIAGSATGSGKTLAFGAGMLHKTKKDFGIQGLILTPTRELAEQIVAALKKFSKFKKLNIVMIYGGVSMQRQIEELRDAEIVVATPGRLLDHIERRSVDLRNINMLVLDEADRMLDMGFINDVKKIISKCPEERQTLLFSATISDEIVGLSKKFLKNPVEISAKSYVDPTKMNQVFYDVADGLKFSLLVKLLKEEHSGLVMIFCNTRRNADFVCNNLHNNGLNAQAIHGGLTQDKRRRILQQFHSKETLILVCTDVAARGLDIPAVSHVYNYDTPKDPKEYVHRIGRTARAGKEGKVINIISSRDYDNFSNVLNKTDFKIEQAVTPFVERINIQKFEGRARREGGRDRYQGSSNSRGSSGGRSYSRGKTSGSGRPYRDRPSSSESSDSRDNSGSERSSYGRSSGSRSYSSGGRRPSSNRSSGRSSSYRRR